MSILRKIKHFFILLLLPATVVLFFNNQTNKHYHLLPSGEVIVHSHPFNKKSDSPHKHSQKELNILANIYNFFSLEAANIVIIFTVLAFSVIKVFERKTEILNIHFISKMNRAPPIDFIY